MSELVRGTMDFVTFFIGVPAAFKLWFFIRSFAVGSGKEEGIGGEVFKAFEDMEDGVEEGDCAFAGFGFCGLYDRQAMFPIDGLFDADGFSFIVDMFAPESLS